MPNANQENNLTINRYFSNRLQAPLRNAVWSWGAICPHSNSVFLRVGSWTLDRYEDGKDWVILYTPEWDTNSSRGVAERLTHIELIKNGARGFAVIVEFNDHGKIESYDQESLLVLGKIESESGSTYAEVVKKVPVSEVVDSNPSVKSLTQDIADISTQRISQTQRKTLIDARVGQGKFRDDVLKLWNNQCVLTGSATIAAIRASHIKPWSVSSNQERLDPYNGIPLLATYDALFDKGLISFDSNGKLLVSDRLSNEERQLLNLEKLDGFVMLYAETDTYMDWHRAKVFKRPS